jgi:hypothetical protein
MEQKAPLDNAGLAQYGTLTSHLSRALKLLGLKRVLKDMTPTLQSYLEARAEPDDSQRRRSRARQNRPGRRAV